MTGPRICIKSFDSWSVTKRSPVRLPDPTAVLQAHEHLLQLGRQSYALLVCIHMSATVEHSQLLCSTVSLPDGSRHNSSPCKSSPQTSPT